MIMHILTMLRKDNFKYLKISADTVRQINLKMPERLLEESSKYVEEYGYRNLQDLILELLRNKVLVERYKGIERKMDGKRMEKAEALEYVEGL